MDTKTKRRIEEVERGKGLVEPSTWTRKAVKQEITKMTSHPELDRPLERKRGRPRTEERDDIVKTNLDLSEPVLDQLDEIARALNISRQAVIKMWIHEKLVEYRLSQAAHG